MIQSLIALVPSGLSLASPRLAPGESFSGATALVARNRRFLMSLRSLGQVKLSVAELRPPFLSGFAYCGFPGTGLTVQASAPARSPGFPCSHSRLFEEPASELLTQNNVCMQPTGIFLRGNTIRSSKPAISSKPAAFRLLISTFASRAYLAVSRLGRCG